jgi:hypothetical protein
MWSMELVDVGNTSFVIVLGLGCVPYRVEHEPLVTIDHKESPNYQIFMRTLLDSFDEVELLLTSEVC